MLVFGARQPVTSCSGLPELEVTGLRDVDARALLDSVTHSRLDQRIRDRIVAETKGNPLALLELPRGLTHDPDGGRLRAAAPGHAAGTDRAELPDPDRGATRGRPGCCCWSLPPNRSATRPWCGVPLNGSASRAEAAVASGMDGLLSVDERVTFRHPLVRSAVYRAAIAGRTPGGARCAGRGRSMQPPTRTVTPGTAPQRRPVPTRRLPPSWKALAERARARGGLAAAAAFLQRSAALTTDAVRRDGRAISAARTSMDAGDFAGARRLLDSLRNRPLSEPNGVEAELLAGSACLRRRAGTRRARAAPVRRAPTRGVGHRRRSRDLPDRVAGSRVRRRRCRPGGAEGDLPGRLGAAAFPRAVSVRSTCCSRASRCLILEGRAGAAGKLREAGRMFATDEISLSDVLHWGLAATAASNAVWDFHTSTAIARQHVETAQAGGRARPASGALDGAGRPDGVAG